VGVAMIRPMVVGRCVILRPALPRILLVVVVVTRAAAGVCA